jgi:hypothetical protein
MKPHPVWPRALHPSLSTCRGAADRHPCSPEHVALVESYRLAVAAWTDAAEAATGGYAAEMADFERDHPRPTLRRWLEMSR